MALLILPFLGFIEAYEELRTQDGDNQSKSDKPTASRSAADATGMNRRTPSDAASPAVGTASSSSLIQSVIDDHQIPMCTTSLAFDLINKIRSNQIASAASTTTPNNTSSTSNPTSPMILRSNPLLQKYPNLQRLTISHFLLELLLYLIFAITVTLEPYNYYTTYRPIIAISRFTWGCIAAFAVRHIYARVMALLYEREYQKKYSAKGGIRRILQRSLLYIGVLIGELAWPVQVMLLVVAGGVWARAEGASDGWDETPEAEARAEAFEEVFWMALGQFVALCLWVGLAVGMGRFCGTVETQ